MKQPNEMVAEVIKNIEKAIWEEAIVVAKGRSRYVTDNYGKALANDIINALEIKSNECHIIKEG